MVRKTRGASGVALGLALTALWPAANASAAIYQVAAGTPDLPDADTTDAFNCDAAGPTGCTLRAAVQTANGTGSPGPDKIQILSGGFTLTIDNVAGDENAAATGDLDLTSDIEIEGFGGPVTISGQGPPSDDRIFHIPSGSPAITMSNLTITKGNAADGGWGGGIKHESGALTITNSSITDNEALGSGARGGGIYSSGGSSLTLTDVNVNANQAPQDASVSPGAQGGGIYSATPITFTRVAIYGNNANFGCGAVPCGGNGGGLYEVGGGTLTNVTVSGNIAGGNPTTGAGGGGGISTGGGLTVVNSTIQHNFAMGPSGTGGGNIASGSGLYLQSTIVSDGETIDRAPGAENCGNDTGSPTAFNTLGNNLEARSGQGASQCGLTPGVNGDITAMSAGLDAALLFNGGAPTPTHALLPGSPAIDAGALTGPATDQRGVVRPQGSRCDIGAFELEQPGATHAPSCAGPPAPPVSTPLVPATTAAPSPPRKKCKKGRKLKKGKCVRKKKRR